MATKKAETGASSAAATARKRRSATVKYFAVGLYGREGPIMVMAPNIKAAIASLVTIREVTARDMISAVQTGDLVIDSTDVKGPQADSLPLKNAQPIAGAAQA